jgi:hypothetical protein
MVLADMGDSDVLGSSVLECRVYTKHNIGTDNFIGGTKEVIGSLLAEGAEGGMYLLMLALFADINSPLAITRELCKHDAHGNKRKTQTILKFTLVAISKTSDAAGLNMEEAVSQGINAICFMESAPSFSESATVINNTKSASTAWGALLQKVKLFSEFVDAIAEV